MAHRGRRRAFSGRLGAHSGRTCRGREAELSEDDGDFAALVAHLDPAMAIVTAVSGGERAGCLVGFSAQCSITPPRYVVWLSKANHTFRVALHARHFAVHFLAEDVDDDLPRLFGTVSGDDVDKFARCDWDAGPGGVPVLRGCPHRFTAERVAVLDEGSDHVCVVVAPLEIAPGGPFRPLRLSQVTHLDPGHEAGDRPTPTTERDDGA